MIIGHTEASRRMVDNSRAYQQKNEQPRRQRAESRQGQIRRLYRQGMPVYRIAHYLGISRDFVSDVVVYLQPPSEKTRRRKISIALKGRKKTPEELDKRKGMRKGEYFNCIKCGKEFYRKPSAIKNGHNKFCSRSCCNQYQRWGILLS